MKQVIIWTNDFYHNEVKEKEVMDALNSGYAVRVGADCIGHTRAMMIRKQAKDFFERIGAKKVHEDVFGEYYAL